MRGDQGRYVQHLIGRGHLEIERLGNRRLQPRHVRVLNMAAVLAQMRGDSIGARLDGQQRGAKRVWPRPTARVTDRRHMVNIHAKTQWRHWRLPGIGVRAPQV